MNGSGNVMDYANGHLDSAVNNSFQDIEPSMTLRTTWNKR